MSYTLDDARADTNEMLHETSKCDSWNCPYCEEEVLHFEQPYCEEEVLHFEQCRVCTQPIHRGTVCRTRWDESHA